MTDATKEQQLKKFLEDRLTTYFSKADNTHIESVLAIFVSDMEKLGYVIDNKEVSEGASSWIHEHKSEYLDGYVTRISINGVNFYLHATQDRSGSYYTDWYYSAPMIQLIQTEAEFTAPTVVCQFKFKQDIIHVQSDGSARIASSSDETQKLFVSVEEAINHIIKVDHSVVSCQAPKQP